MRRLLSWGLSGLLCWLAGQAQAIELAVPLACDVGKDCWIQQYPDHSHGGTPKDYRCKGATYGGHDGVDLRVRNTASMIKVLAAAPGEVVATRDGMEDLLADSEALLNAVKSKECGNGVLLSHPEGYQTQYCHMRKGSIAVKAGDKVAAGTLLGEVGYSGAAAFPHLHFALRKDGQKLDPFAGALSASCETPTGKGFWSAPAAAALAYHDSDLLEVGFSSAELDTAKLERGLAGGETPKRDSSKLLGYARAINLKSGDELKLALTGPAGVLAEKSFTLDHDKAEYVQFLGIRVPPGGLAAGPYAINLQLWRGGNKLWDETSRAEVK